MQYKGWNFEKTLLIQSRSGARAGELIDVRIPVDDRSAGNLASDVRVVLKKDWHLVERELPSQVYDIRRDGAVATCRVAFVMDVPAADCQRVGIYYDNPGAPAAGHQSPLERSGSGSGGTVKTPHMTAGFDERTGLLKTLTGRFEVPSLDPLQIPLIDRMQEHAAVVLAARSADGSRRAEYASPAMWDRPEVTADIGGPVFVKIARRGKLTYPGCPAPDRCPECEITYRFFAHVPYFLVHTRLTFVEDTDVFGIRVGGLTVSRQSYTHYTFRPVSPNLPDTDVEEMGHVLIDPQHTAGLPAGPAMADLLPYEIAWHGFLRTRKTLDAGLAAIQLRHAARSPAGEFPYYRAGAQVLREPDVATAARAPIYVKVHRPENVVTVPAGSVIENLDAVVCDRFDMDWGTRTDALGKRLNQPVEIAVHPRFMLGDVPPEPFEPLPYGQRGDAYRRYGVR